MPLDGIGYTIAQSVYQNTPRTLAAVGAVWLNSCIITKLGLDYPKVTLAFTAMTSVLYYATKPLFNALESSKVNYPSRVVSLVVLTMAFKDLLKLNLPWGGTLMKVSCVAGTFIALFDKIDKILGKDKEDGSNAYKHLYP
jgi:MFS superfamily sulfate permease-like transporter